MIEILRMKYNNKKQIKCQLRSRHDKNANIKRYILRFRIALNYAIL